FPTRRSSDLSLGQSSCRRIARTRSTPPISRTPSSATGSSQTNRRASGSRCVTGLRGGSAETSSGGQRLGRRKPAGKGGSPARLFMTIRSEERRVGKGGYTRGAQERE